MQTIQLISEGFLYIYLGISVWQLMGGYETEETPERTYEWSLTFYFIELIIIIISRVASIVLPSLLFSRLILKKKWRLNTYEIIVLCYTGIIRGAIAYALI